MAREPGHIHASRGVIALNSVPGELQNDAKKKKGRSNGRKTSSAKVDVAVVAPATTWWKSEGQAYQSLRHLFQKSLRPRPMNG
jgi:hypothetical protein